MFDRKMLKYLIKWKDQPDRKPLVIRGARQVGKTSIVIMFAKDHFKNLIHINLEKTEHLRLFKKELSLKEFLTVLQIEFKQEIIPQETLIFIDEIQNSPSLIALLRFFYEERPDIPVIAAGSLLEAKIHKEGLSFPVGRVEFCYLYPLDFFEFLNAKGQKELLTLLEKADFTTPPATTIHELAEREFSEYAMIGGMPGILKEYLVNQDINKLRPIYASLLTAYTEDVNKYAPQAEAKYLSHIIDTAPLFAGNTFTYEKFGGSNFRSREMSKAFSLLEKVMLLSQIRATSSCQAPLVPKEKRPKKLIYLDVGLVNYRMNILNDYLRPFELDGFYQGRIAEQLVGQNLLASYLNSPPSLLYWARERKEGSAEVDFCLNFGSTLLGLEVKAGKTGRLKSLLIFGENTQHPVLVRFYSGELKRESASFHGKTYSILSIPFYLLPRYLALTQLC